MTYFGPALDPSLGGFGQKVITNEWSHEYFIPTKFGKYPSSDSIIVQADYGVHIHIHALVHPLFHLNK